MASRYQDATNALYLGRGALFPIAFEVVLKRKESHPAVTPLLAILTLQLFAYYIAVLRGCNVDQPRNLAKSVTVE